MFKRIKNKIEEKRDSKELLWKSLVFGKDFVWASSNLKQAIREFLLYKSLKRYNRPWALLMTMTKKCNAHCIMCNIWKGKTKETSIEDYEKFLKINHNFLSKISHLSLSGGEAFLRKDFNDMVILFLRYLPSLEEIRIATNGMNTNLIEARLNSIIKEYPDKEYTIQVSYDGFNKIMEKIRGVKNINSKVDETIERLKRNPKIRIILNYLIFPMNINQINKFADFCQTNNFGAEFSFPIINKNFFNHTSDKNPFKFSEKNINQLKEIFTKRIKRPKYIDMISMLEGKERKRGCLMPFNALFIESDGRIFHCGNYKKRHLVSTIYKNIENDWFSKKHKNIIKQLVKEDCKVCNLNCTHYIFKKLFWRW